MVADEVYGHDGKFWWWLEQQHQQPYLLTVGSQHSVCIGYQEYRAKSLAQSLQSQHWQRLSCGNGTKGERIYDWALMVNSARAQGFSRWLLFRRNLEKPDDPHSITYYQVYAPANTMLEEMGAVAGQRWWIEECFTVAKDQLGLSEYEVRSWQGWHRHVSLVMAAQAFLTVLRHQIEPLPVSQKFQPQRSGAQQYGCLQSGTKVLVPLSIPELQKLLWKLLFPVFETVEQVLHWSFWRRSHQATAHFFHYKNRFLASSA
ncbi:hypothetical protein NDA01_29935 [Trichocoleus desertorum AS-A10]|uniref:IS701 family transposase n=1 Tax=Trichocoleus desertorum TaxID=1481672 RepID=UPI00329841FC